MLCFTVLAITILKTGNIQAAPVAKPGFAFARSFGNNQDPYEQTMNFPEGNFHISYNGGNRHGGFFPFGGRDLDGSYGIVGPSDGDLNNKAAALIRTIAPFTFPPAFTFMQPTAAPTIPAAPITLLHDFRNPMDFVQNFFKNLPFGGQGIPFGFPFGGEDSDGSSEIVGPSDEGESRNSSAETTDSSSDDASTEAAPSKRGDTSVSDEVSTSGKASKETTSTQASEEATTPSDGSEETLASGSDETTTPASDSEETTTSASGSEETTTTAAESEETTTPAAGSEETTTPADGSSETTTPAAGSDETTTAGESDNLTSSDSETSDSSAGSEYSDYIGGQYFDYAGSGYSDYDSGNLFFDAMQQLMESGLRI